MTLFSRVKKSGQMVGRGVNLLRGKPAALPSDASPRRAEFELQLPNPFGGEPICRARLCLTTTPHAHGDTVRLQAHLNGCLKLPDAVDSQRDALPGSAAGSIARRGRVAAGGLVRLGVSRLPAQVFAPVLQRRLQTWMDVQISSAPLAAGADALIPERLRGMMRQLPQSKPGEPRVAGWSGDIEGPHRGVAQFMVLQMDQTDLPPELRGEPFNLSASFASTLVDESKQRDQ